MVIYFIHCLTIHEVAEEDGTSKTMCLEILTENFGMNHVAAKFVPYLLSEDQKQNHVSVKKELVDSPNADENLKNIVTSDETMRLQQKPILRSGFQKSHPDPKKSTASSVQCECDAFCVF